MAETIFIVEDDPTIISIVQQQLEQWQYHCVQVQDFQQVLTEVQAASADLVLLDVALPVYNGFYWCQKIREQSEIPILFLSSMEDNLNQIMAMNMGADDFMVKPVDLNLLVAKIQALLRRSYQYGQKPLRYFLKEAIYEPTLGVISQDNQRLTLTPTENHILAMLCQQANHPVPKAKLIESLWANDAFIDANTLAVNMTRLRKKLRDLGLDDVIQTVKNKGYLIEVSS